MSGSTASERLQLLVAGYILGNLDPEEAAEFEHLLNDDPAIAEEVNRMQKTLELSYAPPEMEPPAHLRSAILSAHASQSLAPVQASAPIQSVTGKPIRRSFSWSRAINVAAAIAIATLAINNYRLRQALQASQIETQRLATIVYSLQTTSSGNTASATIEVDPNRLEAALTVQNLPPLTAGKVYALWTVVEQDAPVTKDDKNAILTEVFTVDAQGRFSQAIAVPKVFRSADWVSNVAVTVEDAVAPQEHQGEPVMMTDL
jgi:anti-sigma-K factor RskA